MTIDRAIELLRVEYDKACKDENIYNPVAYALHKVQRKTSREFKKLMLSAKNPKEGKPE